MEDLLGTTGTDSQFTEAEKSAAEEQILENQKISDYDIREYPLEVLVSKFVENLDTDEAEIFIPDYQREMVWKPDQKSRFIESILLNLPIPYLFLSDNDEGRSEVVDGSQRIRTIVEYFQNQFPLNSLKLLDKLNGFYFSDLPIVRQRRFKKKTIRLIEMTSNMDEEARRQMFDRLNTGGTKLTSMEQRIGSKDGPFTSFIYELGGHPKFHELCPISKVRRDRREYQELVLRFFAYLHNYEAFNKRVDSFLDDYLDSMNTNGFNEEECRRVFEGMLTFVESTFPYGFKKNQTNNSVPRIRYEAMAVGSALALKENPNLTVEDTNWLFSKEFGHLTRSDASNSRPKLINRLHFVRDQLLGRDIEYSGNPEKIFHDPRLIDADTVDMFE